MNAPNQLSFLPDDYLARKVQRRTNVICATLFLVAMGAIASAFTLSERATHAMVLRHDEVDQQYADAAKKLEQVGQMQDKQRRMAHQAEVTASLLEKVPRSFLLAEFTNSLPAGVSLIELSMESKLKPQAPPPAPKTAFEQKKTDGDKKNKTAAPAGPPVKMYDVVIKLTGVAQTDVQVAQFINKLSQSKLLMDVNLVIVDQFTVDSDKVRKFQLEMLLNPEASVDPNTKPVLKTAAIDTQPAGDR
ncbi:MAG TPA: PilN domain-containing protein [Tepidisphaeraceae bacterium]|jgi:Tfp pilus assembly protein PilN|nr:PilN domain-containing protein [Tepidisphaeraceae bacterium]